MTSSLWSWFRRLFEIWFRRHAVVFDAQSAAPTVDGRDGASTTWSHTVARDSTLVVGLRWVQSSASGPSPTRSVSWNGQAMDPIGVYGSVDNGEITDANGIYLEFFGLLRPQAGPGTIIASVTRRADYILVDGCAVSYARVGAWGITSAIAVGGANDHGGTVMKQEVTSKPNERVIGPNDRVVHMFTTGSPGTIYTDGYSQTLRHVGRGFAVGDAPGAKEVSFRASRGSVGTYYAGLALRLLHA